MVHPGQDAMHENNGWFESHTAFALKGHRTINVPNVLRFVRQLAANKHRLRLMTVLPEACFAELNLEILSRKLKKKTHGS